MRDVRSAPFCALLVAALVGFFGLAGCSADGGSADGSSDHDGAAVADTGMDDTDDAGPDDTDDPGSADAGAPECTVDGDCDDGNPCTADSCIANTCIAGFTARNDQPCDTPEDPCSTNAVCVTGVCQGQDPKSCDDADPCTVDSCDGQTGDCLHDAAAAEGVTCSETGVCDANGSCVEG